MALRRTWLPHPTTLPTLPPLLPFSFPFSLFPQDARNGLTGMDRVSPGTQNVCLEDRVG
jgi:hypothetical protein